MVIIYRVLHEKATTLTAIRLRFFTVVFGLCFVYQVGSSSLARRPSVADQPPAVLLASSSLASSSPPSRLSRCCACSQVRPRRSCRR